MNDSDKIKMTLNIGGEYLQISVPFNRQDAVRDAEKAVADKINAWKMKWPGNSDSKLLAMAAYQFASLYHELLERHESAAAVAEKCSSRLDSIIEALSD